MSRKQLNSWLWRKQTRSGNDSLPPGHFAEMMFHFPPNHSKFMSLDISLVCRKLPGLEPQSYCSDLHLVALWHFSEPLPAGGPAHRQAGSICQLKMAGETGSSRTPAGRKFRAGEDEKGMRKDETHCRCKIYIKYWLLISGETKMPGWISWVRNMAMVPWCLELLCLDFLAFSAHKWVYLKKKKMNLFPWAAERPGSF